MYRVCQSHGDVAHDHRVALAELGNDLMCRQNFEAGKWSEGCLVNRERRCSQVLRHRLLLSPVPKNV